MSNVSNQIYCKCKFNKIFSLIASFKSNGTYLPGNLGAILSAVVTGYRTICADKPSSFTMTKII
jgi:hypothetical protein